MINFWQRENRFGYHIVGDYNGIYYTMWLAEMAIFLNIDSQFLSNTLIKEYNGFIPFGTSGRVYFKDQSDANKAIQWLESVKISLILK